MARKPVQARLYQELADRYGRRVAEAFLAAVADLRSGVEVQRLIRAIEAGRIEEALQALHLDPAVYDVMLERIRESYQEAGRTTAGLLPSRGADGLALVVRFDGRNLRAEAWLSRHAAQLITRIVEDQRVAVRTALTEGMAAGRNPRATALRIVGRVSRATGRREGGILGLSGPQERYVASARAELASGDPAALRRYLGRSRRDRRFDRTILRAIREGTAVPADVQERAATAYERRLLQSRAELIAKHETFAAIEEARQEAYQQAVDAGQLEADAITKTWRHFANEHPRLQHVGMNGETVRFDRPFIMPDGTQMRFPHDPEAPISHTAGCHCQADYRIDFFRALT